MRFSQVHWPLGWPPPAQVFSVVPLDEVSRGVVVGVGVVRLAQPALVTRVGALTKALGVGGVVALEAGHAAVVWLSLLVRRGLDTVGVHLVTRVQRPGRVQRVAALQRVAVTGQGLGVGELIVLVEDEDDGDDEDDDDADEDHHRHQHVLTLTGADADHAPSLTIITVITVSVTVS